MPNLSIKTNVAGKSKGKNQGMYYLYLEAVSVRNAKSQATSSDVQCNEDDIAERMSFDLCSFTNKDLEFVTKFLEVHGSDVFRQLIHSVCPSIYGHELVKGDKFFNKYISHINLTNIHQIFKFLLTF